MNWTGRGLLGLVALCLGAVPAQATIITYEVANIAGNTFEYSYTVENDTLATDIEQFAVYFEVGLFENLSTPDAPAGWDPIVIQPDPGLPDDGFYDVLALFAGIAPGDTLGGFTVQADFLGAGSPGSQPFDIIDPLSFATIDTGFTVPAGVIAIPEPGSLWIMGLGLLALGAARAAAMPASSQSPA